MSHFSLKSLMFYGAAIGFVVALFSLTTAYGETNLQPAPKIAGRYRLAAQTLPGCLKAEMLVVTVQQSGIYLNASLAPLEPTVAPTKLTLSLQGFWRSGQLTLAGRPTALKACLPTETVQISGTIHQKTLQGTIGLGATSTDFTANYLAEPAQTTGH